MAEKDDSEDHIKKPKRKYRKVRTNVGGVMKIISVPIKQPEPYIGQGGVVVTGEHKKKYANAYKKKGKVIKYR